MDGTINAEKYISVLEKRLLPKIKDGKCQNDWIFHHDSAPCHAVKKVKSWCAKNEVKLLSWVGNSPDMNPIENLWYFLKEEIHSVPITNKNVLIEKLIHVWFHSPKIKEECINLIKSMLRRGKALIKAKGGQTKN